MNLPHSGRSAAIYQFPKGGRRGFGLARDYVREMAEAPAAPFIMEGSWYHEEAIREDAEPSVSGPTKRN